MTNYEDFSKQDLKDRKGALLKEFYEAEEHQTILLNEIQEIHRLIKDEEMK